MCQKKKDYGKGSSLHRGPVGGRGEGPAAVFVNRGLRETVKECSVNGVSACGSSVRGTWREGSFTENSES